MGSHGVTCHPAEVTFPPQTAVVRLVHLATRFDVGADVSGRANVRYILHIHCGCDARALAAAAAAGQSVSVGALFLSVICASRRSP